MRVRRECVRAWRCTSSSEVAAIALLARIYSHITTTECANYSARGRRGALSFSSKDPNDMHR